MEGVRARHRRWRHCSFNTDAATARKASRSTLHTLFHTFSGKNDWSLLGVNMPPALHIYTHLNFTRAA
eukprot:124893-Chlamydomonas_euryale.AAC.2